MSGLESIGSTATDFTNNILVNSNIIFVIALIIILYVLFFPSVSSLSSSTDSYSSSESSGIVDGLFSLLSSLIGIFLLFLLLLICLKFLFGIDIIKYFYNVDIYKLLNEYIYGPPPEINLPKFNIPDLTIREQVFNIPQNTYDYKDAKALCKAYGSRLATYKEVEDSYNDGGEWCNYGWSEDQMALFPTQQKTYDGLQKIKGHEHDCGRPGVNGGFIANPNLRFGVNCYGKKPRMSELEEELMATQPIYPRTKEEIELEEKVKYWKEQLSSVLVSPFNHYKWSRY